MKTLSWIGIIVVLALSAAWASHAQSQHAVVPPGVIDLNEAGALEALQHSNPVHYEKVRNSAGSRPTSTGATSPMVRSC
jgi:hypothetical protein